MSSGSGDYAGCEMLCPHPNSCPNMREGLFCFNLGLLSSPSLFLGEGAGGWGLEYRIHTNRLFPPVAAMDKARALGYTDGDFGGQAIVRQRERGHSGRASPAVDVSAAGSS